MHRKAVFKPLEHALEVDSPSLHQNLGYAAWPSQNFAVRQRSLQKRDGYAQVRNVGENGDGDVVIVGRHASRSLQ